jgi:hypothetical protein
MFTQGISEELGRPDDFHVMRRERRSRRNKLPARKLEAPSSEGRLEACERTRKRMAQRGNGRATDDESAPDEHQESEHLEGTNEGGELNPGGPSGGKRDAGTWS